MKNVVYRAVRVFSAFALGVVVTQSAFANHICLDSEDSCFPEKLPFLKQIYWALASFREELTTVAGAGIGVLLLERLTKKSAPTVALFMALGIALAFSPHALAQVDLGGGKSMMGDLGFLKDIGSTSQDIMFLVAKLLGAGLVLFGVKSIGQRNWEYAIPQLVGGGGLFFVPQIVAAFQKMAGG